MAAVVQSGELPAAPKTSLFRAVAANDAALPTEKKYGLNCADFDEVVVYATTLGGATAATVTVYFWAPSKDGTPNGGFVPNETAQTLTLTGAGAAEMKIIRTAHQESMWLGVSGLAGGTGERIRLDVSGVPVYGQHGG